ncbi:MAG: serine hydrolase domain-containing protein [Armatimonas sp.]
MTLAENPEKVGFSAERLKRIDEMLLRHIREHRLMGSVTLVARQGQPVHFAANGFQDAETKQPMTINTRFRLASSSKPITAAAVLLLVEEGLVRLSDPVARFLPEFAESKVAVERHGSIELVPAERPITVHDLLTHTGGLASDGLGAKQVPPENLEPHGQDTLATYAKRLAKVPLDFPPGSQWRYSGIAGFDVLAHIIEIASGQSFDAFLHERIFAPLGMSDTTFVHQPEDDGDDIASVYRQSDKAGKKMQKIESGLRFPKGYYSGAGGLISTAPDFFRFLQLLANGGELEGTRLLSPRTVELLSANHVGALYREGLGFGLGVEVVLDSARADTFRSVGSHTWYGAFGTYAWVDPKEQLVSILLQQSPLTSMVEGILRDFETAVMQALVVLS